MKLLREKINVQNILLLFIIAQPIIDIITSLSIEYLKLSITFGIIIRTIFMVCVAILGLLKAKKKYKIGMGIYYGALLTYMIGFLIDSYITNGTNLLFVQIKGLVKTFYLPIIIVALIPIFKEYKINVITIFITSIIGIAFPTYKVGDKAGTVGLFYSANEIGAILCLLAPFLLVDFMNKKVPIYNWISLLLLAYSILQIGTKVPYFSFIMLMVCLIFVCLMKIREKYFYKKAGMFLSVLVAVYLVTGLTPVGSNLRNIYGDIFLVTPEMFKTDVEPPKPEVKIESIEELKTVSVSGRNDFLKENKEKFINSSLKNKFIGIGFIDNKDGQIQELKLTEMDYYDILFCSGIIGTILFAIPTLGLVITLIYNTIKKKNKIQIEVIYSIVMSGVVAMLAGHVLVSPAVSIYIAIILLRYNFELQDIQINNVKKENEDNEKRNYEENNDTSIALGSRGN